ncbi:hypothetical protein BDP27DRAFT_1310560 [Rhodocollybia butyracea]|uniref:Phosphatidate phosphatase APP1 catalytic domain-containing protein n=1 Tax=Rhodocollybia butyracea TaxID=206335 RepID=A0A9P5UG57_9AGAR|nr:hypothetical protein BDP27DRAFT_1310560 [Rhodocollybia butyracea]
MSSWRKSALSAASSRLSSFKGYIAQKDFKVPEAINRGKERAGNFRDWAGQKLNNYYQISGTEKIALFPGWAARRYPEVTTGTQEEPFEIQVYVSGFASAYKSSDTSRSQRAFIRLAKGFAALPKLDGDPERESLTDSQTLTRSTEELLNSVKLPPRPNDITEDYEVERLEREFQKLSHEDRDSPYSRNSSTSDLATEDSSPVSSSLGAVKSKTSDEIRRLHANLESRLQPFWSSVVPNRTIRCRLYTSPHHIDEPSVDNGPVATQDVITANDGSFQVRFTVEWKDLCNHPGALHIAFGDPDEEHDLLVTAELLSPPSPTSSASSSTADLSTPYFSQNPKSYLQPTTQNPPTTLRVSLTHSPVHIVSDIDDTVKFSNVMGGARAVFHNVFVKELQELVIPGMGEWYEKMWKMGARFHYVSNGPFELLPLIGEFFQISKLPLGSVKLRSYAGKSLFSGLLSAPSARKRAGVLELLEAFPNSKFILVGDSGEQDLELYTELARERTSQVLAIFIRDVGDGEPLSDPTGNMFDKAPPPHTPIRSAPPSLDIPGRNLSGGDRLNGPTRTLAPLTTTLRMPLSAGLSIGLKSADYFSPNVFTAEPEQLIDFGDDSPITPTTAPPSAYAFVKPTTPVTPATPRSSLSTSTGSKMPEGERKRYELQMRVYKAKAMLVSGESNRDGSKIILRVFKSPLECVETWGLLDRYLKK